MYFRSAILAAMALPMAMHAPGLPARAPRPVLTPTITLNVSAAPTAATYQNDTLTIPVILDMSLAAGQNIAAITFNVTWDPTKFDYISSSNGNLGWAGPANTSNVGSGTFAVSLFDAVGINSGTPTAYTIVLRAKAAGTALPVAASVVTAGSDIGATLTVGTRNLAVDIAGYNHPRAIALTTQPANSASGGIMGAQPVVELRDGSNALTAGSGIAVTAALVGGTGALSGTTTVNTVGGVATFTDLRFAGPAGSYQLTFTAASLTPLTSNSFAHTQAALKVAFGTVPSTPANSGVAFTTQPVLEIRDADNVRVAGSSAPVTASVFSGSGTLTGTTTRNAVSGTATFTDLVLNGPSGNVTLQFASGGLNTVNTAPIALIQTAAKLAITTQPAGAVSGTAFTTQPVVMIQDIGGTIVANSTASVTASVASGTGTLAGTATVVAVGGVATFSGLKINGSGNHTLSFASGGLTGATSQTLAVAAPDTFIVWLGADTASNNPIPGTLTLPLRVDLTKAVGRTVGSITSTITWDPTHVAFDSVKSVFGTLTSNTTQTASGTLQVGMFDANGLTSSGTVLNVFVHGLATGKTLITNNVTAMGDVLGVPLTGGANGVLTVLQHRACFAVIWGDVNADGLVTIVDAQQVARYSVGLSVGNLARLTASGDVTADGFTTIVDAQQIARYSVALSAAARINTLATVANCP